MAVSMDSVGDINPKLSEIVINLDNFIENINCLRESFNYSDIMLRQQKISSLNAYNKFVTTYRVQDENENKSIVIPNEKLREFHKLSKKKDRAEKASELIPPTYIISLVSLFDSFLAGLVRCVYNLKPDLLLDSQQLFTYREIVKYDTTREVKKIIIDNTIDKLFRDSHKEQIKWFEKAFEVNTLKKFAGWGDFIELTERRNLFVHAEGIVSGQYLEECSRNDYKLDNINIGRKLKVDNGYFEKSYSLLYEMAIMLTQILINKLYLGNEKFSTDTSVRDNIFINNVYELICEEHFDIAINVSKFAIDKAFKRNNKDKTFIELNLAQAYKWSGKEKECKAILQNLDTSAMNTDLQIPKKVLEEEYDEVYSMMKALGKGSKILTKEAYREWPIFRDIRKQTKFEETFEAIFGEALVINDNSDTADIEDIKDGALANVTKQPCNG